MKEAMQFGALDYLLKPVRKSDLEQVLARTVGELQEQSTVNLFKSKPKDSIRQIFQNINDGYEYAKSDLYREFSNMDVDLSDKFCVGLCFGILTEEQADAEYNYEKNKLVRFVIYDRIREHFKKDNHGFVIRKDDTCCHLVGIIEDAYADTFVEKYILPIKEEIEQNYPVILRVGIGARSKDVSEIHDVYRKAREAYDLYFFMEEEVIDINTAPDERFRENEGIDQFNDLSEQVFSGIASKSENTMLLIGEALDLIRRIHFGNAHAAINQCLIFAGRVMEKLHSYDMIHGDYARMHEDLLAALSEMQTFRELTEYLMDYYEKLLERVYLTVQKKDVSVIVQVKKYLQENYMNDISLKDLAEMVCVSPSYFSTFFKNTTGENYKAYLIKIRMEEALRLVMNTDYKTYEIAERVGYNNVRRFVDAFKNRYDMSPMDYRKLYKKS